MIGFRVINLLIPEEPKTVKIRGTTGTWVLDKSRVHRNNVKKIRDGKCVETYSIQHPVLMSQGSAACDKAFLEMTPLMLGASYLSGLSVTAKRSLPNSDVLIIKPSDHWPRERSMGEGKAVVSTMKDFVAVLEAFLVAWPTAGQKEKVLLLVHHWLDSLACWSFEDLYLSATTLLQIIAATEEAIQGINLYYFDAVTAASHRAHITPPLKEDFKNMRNNLIHEGKLLGGRFSGTSLADCAVVAADVYNWFDEYLHFVLSLGSVRRKRFTKNDFLALNAYSIP